MFRPKMIICGASAYPRDWDYERIRKICDATGAAASPFKYCDIVTTTTHKSLRGPRSGIIFFRKDAVGFEDKINNAVFPALQGGPHEHQIAGVAVQLRETTKPEFKGYIQQVKANIKALGARLTSYGYKLAPAARTTTSCCGTSSPRA